MDGWMDGWMCVPVYMCTCAYFVVCVCVHPDSKLRGMGRTLDCLNLSEAGGSRESTVLLPTKTAVDTP